MPRTKTIITTSEWNRGGSVWPEDETKVLMVRKDGTMQVGLYLEFEDHPSGFTNIDDWQEWERNGSVGDFIDPSEVKWWTGEYRNRR